MHSSFGGGGLGGGRKRTKPGSLRGADALLLAAVERGDHEAVAFLVHEEDVDVNVCDVNGHNANHSAFDFARCKMHATLNFALTPTDLHHPQQSPRKVVTIAC